MTRYYDFLKDCGVFYLVTINGTAPAAKLQYTDRCAEARNKEMDTN